MISREWRRQRLTCHRLHLQQHPWQQVLVFMVRLTCQHQHFISYFSAFFHGTAALNLSVYTASKLKMLWVKRRRKKMKSLEQILKINDDMHVACSSSIGERRRSEKNNIGMDFSILVPFKMKINKRPNSDLAAYSLFGYLHVFAT